MGKPRMTQRDVWMKRDCVVRYRAYCDTIRAHAGKIPVNVWHIEVIAKIPMPDSWSAKKRACMHGKLHRQKPDFDNTLKAVADALFSDDSVIGDGRTTKFWCHPEEAETVITLGYIPENPVLNDDAQHLRIPEPAGAKIAGS